MPKQQNRTNHTSSNQILIVEFTLNLNKFYQAILEQQQQQEINNDQCTADDKGYMVLYVDQKIRGYKTLAALGQGSFGRVVMVETSNGYKVAMKISRNQQYFIDSLKQEMKIYKLLNEKCPGLTCDYIESFQYGDFYCGVIELYDQNLYRYQQRVQRLTCQEMKLVCRKFASWLIQLKQLNIIHTDLKPENCLIKNNDLQTLKLIDFGSCVCENQAQPSYIQSRYYRAPEITFKRNEKYTSAIDQWSIFALLVELATGYTLFPARTSTMLVKMYISLLGMPDKSMIVDQYGEMRQQCKKYFISNNAVLGHADKSYIAKYSEKFKQYNFSEEDQFLLNEETLNSEDKQQCFKRSLGQIIYEKIDNSWTQNDAANFVELIKQGLVYDPEKRLTGEDILNSPFLNSRE